MGKSYRIPYIFPAGHFLPTTPYCFKIDLFENGELSLDASDPGCTNPNFTADYTISAYKSSYLSSALFEAVNDGYNGHFTIMEDSSVNGMEITFNKLNPYTRLFEIIVLMPSCSSPSAVPSFYPSLNPTLNPSVVPTVGTNKPSSAPSRSMTPSSTYATVICASADGSCDPKALLVTVDSLYPVRCCADESMPDWIKNGGCSVWSKSRFSNTCYFSETLSDAKDICAENGGRLCSRTEVENDCAKDPSSNGCLLDNWYIWTSTFS